VDIIVKAKNCEVAPRVREEAIQRVQHATRFFDRLLGVEVLFSEEHNPRIAAKAAVELTARTKGHHIRAEGSGSDHRGAVDVAVGRFERQLARYKARLVDRSRGRDRHVPATAVAGSLPAAATAGPGDGWPRPQIVRTKRFALVGMVPDDAALQLELLGHDFFLFTNASSGICSVVYRRRDGELGLIEGVPADDQPGPAGRAS
jgi:putative sigma-54 modulation protein